ncbi:MAG TPA: PEP-CTERM sorting domain-containing protein [Candidatus Paceibacterota bacterium]|nr:PEP-CTERM sorting domain-containing protein [Candidatus Paceibacterota bacterium]HRT58406.1 PEP-CTERM sorting domain-containing protein [Candidatus Paceibacterota bacterium]
MSFSATSGSRSAQAEFDIISGNLVVTLKNTSGADVLVPSEILTALFFDISGSPVALTPVSALLAPGSVVWFDTPPAGGNVGGEWAYGSGLVGAPMGAKYGISSAGFGLFGQFNFNGPDLDPPPAVNGLNYGITSAGDNMLTGNSAVTGGNPLIHNAVTFTLSGAGAGFDLGRIGNVSFQYGTALNEPNIVVPEPTTMIAGALLLLPFAASTFRFVRRRKQA